jgi:hypothetical protein
MHLVIMIGHRSGSSTLVQAHLSLLPTPNHRQPVDIQGEDHRGLDAAQYYTLICWVSVPIGGVGFM